MTTNYNFVNYSEAELQQILLDDLSNAIARHAAWLDGRTFQKLAQCVAQGYFDESDLEVIMSEENGLALNIVVVDAMRKAVQQSN